MNVMIVGTGVVGLIHGWAFKEAGSQVTHLVRSANLEHATQRFTLDVYDLRPHHQQEQTVTYRPEVVLKEELGAITNIDIAMFPTKHYQLLDALRDVTENIHCDPTYLLFCANWDGLNSIETLLPKDQFVLGYSMASGGYDDSQDTFVLNIRDSFRVGRHDGVDEKRLEQVLALFESAGFSADFKDNMLHWLWVHHAINGGTIGSFIYYGGLQESMNDPRFKNDFVNATREAIEVLKARGVDTDAFSDVQFFVGNSVDDVFDSYMNAFVNTKTGQRVLAHGHFDYAPDEMRSYLMDVVRSAEKLAVNTPILNKYASAL